MRVTKPACAGKLWPMLTELFSSLCSQRSSLHVFPMAVFFKILVFGVSGPKTEHRNHLIQVRTSLPILPEDGPLEG